MANFYILEPEVSGAVGANSVINYSVEPPVIDTLDYYLEIWMGDDLIEGYPCFLVSTQLKSALESLAGSGYSFGAVTITKAEQFDLMNTRQLPEFVWLKVYGKPGIEDCGISADKCLVVSERLLEVLKSFTLNHCLIRRKLYKAPI